MFAFLKRSLVLLLGFLLIFIVIWFGGPWVAIGQTVPLQSASARLIAIGLVVGLWLLFRLYKRLKAFRASDQLLAAVVAQPQPERDRLPADAAKLRQRFEEAVGAIKQQRRGGHSLYDLPWYVIIGAPGSGKTTALINSGLKFPLEQRVGKGALRGVGGTRNCDWWFTDEAIFLDTAGRYTTQDSDAAADSAGWSEFLSLLKKYRARRPINGVVLTISVQDLMQQGAAGRESQVEAARRRVEELNRELKIQLPVYLMVTKADILAGFTDYFDDLSPEGRSQVWGVTFSYDQSVRNEAPQLFGDEFDALIERLNQRIFDRVEAARDARRRTRVFAFPQQVAALRPALTEFVTEVFDASRFDGQVLLRGVYFTSGTQDGTSIDRLLGSIGRRFGAADAVASPAGPGKAYFVEQLLKDVMISESGLAGIDRRLEARKAAVQLGAYAATGLVAATGVAALSVSFSRNRTFLEQTGSEMVAFDRVPRVPSTAPLEQILARLDAVQRLTEFTERYHDDASWLTVRWGLYQGGAISASARDAYMRELDSILLPRIGQSFRTRIETLQEQPDALYRFFKAYMMLGHPDHLDKAYVKSMAEEDMQMSRVPAVVSEGVLRHLQALMAGGETLRPLALDAGLVARAGSSLRQSSMPRILYDAIKRNYSEGPDLRLGEQAGLDFERVFKRRSGAPLAISRFFTRDVFRTVARQGQAELVNELQKDAWLWGENAATSLASAGNVITRVIALYEEEFITAWDGLLDDVEFVPFVSIPQVNEILRSVARPSNSSFRSLVQVVAAQTALPEPPPSATAAGAGNIIDRTLQRVDQARQGVDSLLRSAQQRAGLPQAGVAGRSVESHFQWSRQLTAGEKPPMDAVLAAVGVLQQQVEAVGPDVAGTSPVALNANPAFRQALLALREQGQLMPAQPGELVKQIVDRLGGVVETTATKIVEDIHAEQIVPACRQALANRYPFDRSAPTDVSIAAFGEVFGYGGLFDRFFVEHVEKQAVTTTNRWSWRPGAAGKSQGILDQLQAAQRLRTMFFAAGAKTPSVQLLVAMRDLDRDANRFVMEIDGQRVEEMHLPEAQRPFAWPGPKPGRVSYQFEARFFSPQRVFGGDWALWRLVDDARDAALDAQRVRLNVQTRYNRIQMTMQTASGGPNPLAVDDWRRFSCEP